jgi:hypothetical protein
VFRKRSGHFCWCCGRRRPNERFSGRNHGRHLCRECARLPHEEREYRQGERDIDRLLHGGLHIPRRRRRQFDRFLEHPNARVRDLARQILAEQQRYAEEWRRMLDEEEVLAERFERTLSESRERDASTPDHGGTTTLEAARAQDDGDEDLPF